MKIPRRIVTAVVALSGLALISGCGSSGGSAGSKSSDVSSSVVTDHVHAAVETAYPSGILLATHYGLLDSTDAGRRWTANPALGDDMISGLVHAHGGYAAALMPETETSRGSSAGSSSTAPVEISANGTKWTVARGIPDGSIVTALVQGAGRTVWAPVLGSGIYRSDDEGRDWVDVIPAKVPITTVAISGPNLVIATDSGILVTSADSPTMPALPQLTASVDDLETSARCAACVVATLANGGIAVSGNGGVTWSRRPFHVPFESVASPAGAPKVLIGMSAEPAAKTQGLWRSTDNGRRWRRVLSVPLVDHLYEVPARGSHRPELLAFQWGIQVYASHDDGRTWRRLARAGGVPTGGAMASTLGRP